MQEEHIVGITAQTGANSFFIAIFIGIIFTRIISTTKNKKLNIVFLTIGLIDLFITGKRGMLIFTLLSITFVFLYTLNKDKKNFRKYIFTIAIIASIGYIVIINVPATQQVFEKMEILEKNDDILNGRAALWKKSIETFKKNPIFGVGEGAIGNVIGDYSHNIYIQLLAETGILGTLIYCSAFLSSFINSLKRGAKILKQEDEDIKAKNIVIVSIFIQMLFLEYGFSGNPLYSNIFLTPYIIAIAMINAIPLKKESEANNENRNHYLP